MELSANHQRTLRELIDPGEGAPFAPDLSQRLREHIETPTRNLELPDQLYLSKQPLKSAELCEGRFQAHLHGEREPFDWTPRFAAGKVLHRAAELDQGLEGGEVPHQVVDRAVSELLKDEWRRDFQDYWEQSDPFAQSMVRGEASKNLEAFRCTLPPLGTIEMKRRLAPFAEFKLVTYFLDQRVKLTGYVDLMLNPEKRSSATRLLIDLKTGDASSAYVEDGRLYALLYTLRYGAPPFRVATLFLPSGSWQLEAVDERILFHAADRVVNSLRLASALSSEAEPTLAPGRHCAYCPRRETCPVAE